MALSPAARDLLTRLLSWSADELTDGEIPTAMASMLAAADPSGTAALRELTAGGQVESRPTGIYLVDWATYNLSREKVVQLKIDKIRAGGLGGHATQRKHEPARGPGGRLAGTGPKQTPKQLLPRQTEPAAEPATEARLSVSPSPFTPAAVDSTAAGTDLQSAPPSVAHPRGCVCEECFRGKQAAIA